jgi:hypothetical protein
VFEKKKEFLPRFMLRLSCSAAFMLLAAAVMLLVRISLLCGCHAVGSYFASVGRYSAQLSADHCALKLRRRLKFPHSRGCCCCLFLKIRVPSAGVRISGDAEIRVVHCF